MVSQLSIYAAGFRRRVLQGNIVVASFWLSLYTIFPSFLISAVVLSVTYYLLPDWYAGISAGMNPNRLSVFPATVINPLLESCIVAASMRILLKNNVGARWAIVNTAILMALLHSLQSITWGPTVFWFFLVQSYAYCQAAKDSPMWAYVLISFAHGLHNGSMLLVRACAQGFL